MTKEFVADNDTLLFARESLTGQLVKVSMRPYPYLKIASGAFMPLVVLQGHEWDEEIVVEELDSYGIAVVLASDANDGGKVGLIARRMRFPIRTLTVYSEIPWVHIKQCQSKNVDISARYAEALRVGMEKKINAIGYDGDPDYGLQGIFTSQLPRLTNATPLASAANGDQMLTILSSIVTTVVLNCRSIWRPKRLAMPSKQYQLIANTMRASGSDMTVLDQFLKNQQRLGQITEIIEDDTLSGKGDNGTDACLVLPYDSTPDQTVLAESETESEEALLYPIYFAITRDFDLPEDLRQWNDVWYKERAIERVGGVVVAEPLTGAIVSNW